MRIEVFVSVLVVGGVCVRGCGVGSESVSVECCGVSE